MLLYLILSQANIKKCILFMILRSCLQLNLTFLIKPCFAYSFSVGHFKYLYIYMCLSIYIYGSGGLVAKSCLTRANSWTVARQASLAQGIFLEKNTGVGGHFFL